MDHLIWSLIYNPHMNQCVGFKVICETSLCDIKQLDALVSLTVSALESWLSGLGSRFGGGHCFVHLQKKKKHTINMVPFST